MNKDLKGSILSVKGPISPNNLEPNGIILPHEQLLVDLRNLGINCDPAPTDIKDEFTLSNLGNIRRFPYSFPSNLLLDDEDVLIDELKVFKQCGGSVVCEVTPSPLRVRPGALRGVSEATGLHIVYGTGFYVDQLKKDNEKRMSIDELAQFMIDEIISGIPGSDGVRCGIIGEIGCSWPLTDNERKVLQAAAMAQLQTGAPLMIHPGPNRQAPFEIIDILRKHGAIIERTVIAHSERTLLEADEFVSLAKLGCIVELDLFGTECSHYQLVDSGFDMPSDAQRIGIVRKLCDEGYSHRVFISHDIHTKHRMMKYGGHGYGHIPLNIIPKMLARGISNEDINTMTVTAPRKWLTFI